MNLAQQSNHFDQLMAGKDRDTAITECKVNELLREFKLSNKCHI